MLIRPTLLMSSSNNAGQPLNPTTEPQTDDNSGGKEYEDGFEGDNREDNVESMGLEKSKCYNLTQKATSITNEGGWHVTTPYRLMHNAQGIPMQQDVIEQHNHDGMSDADPCFPTQNLQS
ncbi:hypothetical protein HAX54_023169 [Datura stramonium]|uniref:Uncharacterized protein n=1 Tax=Datura stramonium TaxID=4076 RepID=A0ABS8UXL5_DATST|nr:hypothetical protein [Datura stramonium]